jgi:acetolactate synthase-1/2/3 large subunit
MRMTSPTTGTALVRRLEAHGVDTVFGIPGVHTVELYRGLAGSSIRHITPRHEQGCGFMADGYARASGRPGVVFVITGPGLTNTLTAMGQARADSVPMLVVSGVNARASLGRGLGHLHELPDQRGLAAKVALTSARIETADALVETVDAAFRIMAETRPGPTHIELPLDLAGQPAGAAVEAAPARNPERPALSKDDLDTAAIRLSAAHRPVILAGGGARTEAKGLRALAERLDAPVVQTVNARGVLHGHPLSVPASPSLEAVRALLTGADCVLALGTELGQTDYDMYATGKMPEFPGLIRVDLCAEQLTRHPNATTLHGAVDAAISGLLTRIKAGACSDGATRAALTREAARAELTEDQHHQLALLEAARDALPGAFFVGASTQLIYTGNLCYDHDRPGGWFNAATGFGALGYGIPAANGAQIACPDTPVLCLTGDGGAQFVLSELMTAVDEKLPVVFLVWNNHGYGEIAVSMQDADVKVIGCDPSPPDFHTIAAACGIPYVACPASPDILGKAVSEAHVQARAKRRPVIIEIQTSPMRRGQETQP